MSITRHVAVVGAATLVSRVLGFARDVAVAALFGAGARADAFVVAFQLTNLIRRLMTEGALNAALVPLYLRRRDEGGETAAGAFAGQVIGTITLTAVVLSVLLAVLMPLLMLLLAPGFAEDAERLDLAVLLARLMLPYLIMAGPVAVLMGVLNANHRFATAASVAIVFNGTILMAVALIFTARLGDSDASAQFLAIAVAASGLCQFALVGTVVFLAPEKASPLGILPKDQACIFAALAIPGLIASGIPQLTMIAAVIVASDIPGAVAQLYYANRLVELPLGIVGIAIGTVMTPALTHASRSSEPDTGQKTLRTGLEMALALSLPAAIALTILSGPIVRILFERGAFTAADTDATAMLLAALALGLPGQVLLKVLASVFFAQENTRTPMLATLAGLAAALLGSLALIRPFGAPGIAVAVAMSGYGAAGLLWLLAVRRRLLSPQGLRWLRLAQIGICAMIMGAAVYAMASLSGLTTGADLGRLAQTALLAATIAAGLALYLGALWVCGLGRETAPSSLRER